MNRRKFLTYLGSFAAISLIGPIGPLIDLEFIRSVKMLGDALESGFNGLLKARDVLGRPGVTFSDEQQVVIKELEK